MSSKKKIEVTCNICGKKYLRASGSLKNWRGSCSTCKYEIMKADNSKKVICKECGVEFSIKNSSNYVFCSTDCYHKSTKGKPSFKKGVKSPETAGSNSPHWKGGITPENKKIRASAEMLEWRRKVLHKDNYTCCKCNIVFHGGLETHHILNFAEYPDKREDVNNGITFCKEHHKEFHKIFGRTGNDQNQLEEFLTTPTSEIIPIKHRLNIKDPIFIMNFLI